MQEWLNWPAWKASKPPKGFRGSNPLLSAKKYRTIPANVRFAGIVVSIRAAARAARTRKLRPAGPQAGKRGAACIKSDVGQAKTAVPALSLSGQPKTGMSTKPPYSDPQEPFGALFDRLARSDFRRRFRLGPEDFAYIDRKGIGTVCRHAEEFVRTRLAPAFIPNDGRQTPMRGHPVFVAQHATACCCRGCLEKWHGIPAGRAMSPEEQRYVVAVLTAWLERALRRREKTTE